MADGYWNQQRHPPGRPPKRRRSYFDDEVIILDFPESSSKGKAPETSRTLQRVISLDDDDDDDDDGRENVQSSSSGNLHTSVQVDDDDDCQFVQEKCAAFRFSKCNQTFSTVHSSGTRFGLGTDPDSGFSSESDCSDCEILEGPQGEVREQWEKAFLEKMKKTGKAGQSSEEEAGPSNIHCDTTNLRSGSARNPDGGKETSSTSFRTTNGRNPKTSLFGVEMEEDNIAEKCAHSRSEDFAEPSSSLSPKIQERSNSPTADSTSSKKQRKQNGFKVVEQLDTVSVQCKTSEQNQKKKGAENLYTKEVVEEEEDASKSSPPHTSDGDGVPGTAPAVDVMLNREMLKETDEYKKAQEEEWESRQRQLQLQAEEAQRQRKRIKLANTRLLEMERRQKERVEEVRETQKKDEESMNMKEKVRAEITNSLKLLELKCINMATLLRGLGIPVNGGMSPPPQEVHAAYKRAVLKFHPDRASRGDIKQQVEAEEKFKLIARMKEKFLS